MENKLGGSLDTNTLLRLILGDIPEQVIIIEKLLDQPGARFEIADAVVFEIVFVMEKTYLLNRKQIAQNVFTIIRHPKINCNRKLFELTLPLYIEHSKLCIVDCALTQYAQINNASPLYTFDKELAKKCSDFVTLLK